MNIIRVLLLSILYFVAVCSESDKLRIFGGQEIDITQAPYQVAIEGLFSNGKPTRCGGSIVTQRFILTAGHCLTEDDGSGLLVLFVRSGTNYAQHEGEVRSVEGYIVHNKYSVYPNMDFDYGMLKVSTDIDFNEYQSPIMLPDRNEKVGNGDYLIVAGYGEAEASVELPRHLRRIALPKFDKILCAEMYWRGKGIKITDHMMCAGFESTTANNLTTVGVGDSGGALWSPRFRTIQGIVSYRSQLYPTIFSRVLNVVPWIKNVVAGNEDLEPLDH